MTFEIKERLGKVCVRRYAIYHLHSCALSSVSVAPLETHYVADVFLQHLHFPWQEREDYLYQQIGLKYDEATD